MAWASLCMDTLNFVVWQFRRPWSPPHIRDLLPPVIEIDKEDEADWRRELCRLFKVCNYALLILAHRCLTYIDCMITTITLITWRLFSALQSSRVWSPAHVGTHCTHLCSWDQPWTATVGYGSILCCTLEVFNKTTAGRIGLPTTSYVEEKKIWWYLRVTTHASGPNCSSHSKMCNFTVSLLPIQFTEVQ